MVEIFARIATQNGFIPIVAKTPPGDLLVWSGLIQGLKMEGLSGILAFNRL